MKANHIIATILASAVSGCTSKQDAQQTAGAVEFGVAVVAMIPAAPLIEGYHAVAGVSRTLTVYYVYRIKEGVYALSNDNGWFTDRSEQQVRANNHTYLSAWVIDLKKSEKDKKGRIVLSESNLDRWFFRDTDVRDYQRLPENPAIPSAESNSKRWVFSETAANGYQLPPENLTDPSGEYYTSNPGDDFLTLHTADGSSHILWIPRQK